MPLDDSRLGMTVKQFRAEVINLLGWLSVQLSYAVTAPIPDGPSDGHGKFPDPLSLCRSTEQFTSTRSTPIPINQFPLQD